MVQYIVSQKTGYSEEIEPEEPVAIVSVRNHYYIVESCINKYYTYLDILSNLERYYEGSTQTELTEAENENSQIIYNMLDEEYTTANSITTDNIGTKLEKVNNPVIDIVNMYVSEKTDNIYVYIIEGTLRDDENPISDFTMIVKVDFANETFSIIPSDYASEHYANVSVGGTIDIDVPENITINKNNQYILRTVSDDTYARDLFNKLKEEMVYNVEEVYNSLDENYRSTKATDLSNFENYVTNKYGDMATLTADSYQKTNKDEYTQYVIIDTEGNYYIFYETAPMEYRLILDTYTIDIPEFTDRYNEATPQEKVILNINKFMLAINDGDYDYAYNVLADSFKTNNFQNLEAFENYIKTNFYAQNKVDYMEFGNESGTYYTYRVNITDETGANNNTVTKTFIMLLGEGTDFELSFNIN